MEYALKNLKRRPLPGAAVLLFAAIIATVLCALFQRDLEAKQRYDAVCQEIKVVCTVTDLSGTKSNDLDIFTGILSLFLPESFSSPMTEFAGLFEDIRIQSRFPVTVSSVPCQLIGITTRDAAPALWPENGCAFFWEEPFDHSFFSGEDLACLIPESLAEILSDAGMDEAVPLQVSGRDEVFWLDIAGTYLYEGSDAIYVPWAAYREIMAPTGRGLSAQSISATLKSNDDLPVLRELAAQWFAEPDPNNAGMDMVGKYYLALDINDSQLAQAALSLNHSLRVNAIAGALIFLLCALAGVMVGYLMVRSRRREILLLRTLGTPNSQIYLGFAAEQSLCLLLGIALGGSSYLWKPLGRLVLFAALYFGGLSLALLYLLRRGLLSTQKEGE